MCVVDWARVQGFLEILLSWPPIVLTIVITLALMFRSNIGSAIDRLRNLAVGSAQANLAAAQEQAFHNAPAIDQVDIGVGLGQVEAHQDPQPSEPTAPTGSTQGDDSTVPNRELSPAMRSLFNRIQPNVENNTEALLTWIQMNPGPTLESIGQLLNRFTSERIFNVIFGSQVSFVEYLVKTPGLHSADAAQNFFNIYKRRGGDPSGYDTWVSYLVNQNLIENWGPADAPLYKATELATFFIGYIKDSYANTWKEKPL